MKQRRLIRSQIVDSWNRCIDEDYCSQRINSERSLQASFWSHLNRALSNKRRLFIEPMLTLPAKGGKQRVIPDILICNTRSVIAVVELKYQPRGRPNYAKDVRTLAKVARYRRRITVANSRFRGAEKDKREYRVSEHVLYVWAGVHAPTATEFPLYSTGFRSLTGCFLELHAETDDVSKPDVYLRD